jgi:hypothetical protein
MMASSVEVICPECLTRVTVPIDVEIHDGRRTHEGKASMTCTPDLTDLWAHSWAHSPEVNL